MRNNPHSICVKYCPMGRDAVFLITGGEAHIGAVATAYWLDGQVQLHQQELPGHREGPLAAELASLGAQSWQRTITVVMGIHIEKASWEMIEEAVQETRYQFHRELARVKEEG